MNEYQVIRIGMTPEEMTDRINSQVSDGWRLMQTVYNDVTVMGIFSRVTTAESIVNASPKSHRREKR